MAKLSAVLRNENRKRLVAEYAERRNALKAVIRSQASSEERSAKLNTRYRSCPEIRRLCGCAIGAKYPGGCGAISAVSTCHGSTFGCWL
jgi:hypothetical protein